MQLPLQVQEISQAYLRIYLQFIIFILHHLEMTYHY